MLTIVHEAINNYTYSYCKQFANVARITTLF